MTTIVVVVVVVFKMRDRIFDLVVVDELDVSGRVKVGHYDQLLSDCQSVDNVHEETEHVVQRQNDHNDVISGRVPERDVTSITARNSPKARAVIVARHSNVVVVQI